MAMVRCIDCNKEISDQAPVCPNCGRPQRMVLPAIPNQKRTVGFLLGLGILFLPIIFAWFTLRQGHSVLSRVVAFGWLILSIALGNAFSDFNDRANVNHTQNVISESTQTIASNQIDSSGENKESNDQSSERYTIAQENAIRSAEEYLSVMSFSRKGLIEQLSSNAGSGYNVTDATVAVDSLNIDWNEQAVKSAEDYLQTMGFSCDGLVDQLSSDAGSGYTTKQANYAAKKVGICP